MFQFVGLIQQWRNRGNTTADACDLTAEGIPARRVQGDLKWKNEENAFNTFHCLFYFKLQVFHYVCMSLALISSF